MNAMERLTRRLNELLDEKLPGGRRKQVTFATYMGHKEAWISNILSGKRGVRVVDFDKIAAFFQIPVSELIIEDNAELVEATPTERAMLKEFRRKDPMAQSAILTFLGLQTLAKYVIKSPEVVHETPRTPKKK